MAAADPSPPRSHLVVVCKGDSTLVSLDLETLEKVQTVDLSDVGHEVAVDRRGRAFIPLFGAGGVGQPGRSGKGIDEVDLISGERTRTLLLPPGSRSHDAAFGPGGLLYVTGEGLSSVLAIDCDTGRVVSSHPSRHSQAHMLTVTRDGKHAYTANVRPGSLSKVPLTRDEPTLVLPLADHVNRLSISPDERTAYVADQDTPRLAVIDLAELRVTQWLVLPHIAFGTAPTPDGRRLVLGLRQAGRLAVLDLSSGTVLNDVQVPLGPQRVVLDTTGRFAYTACAPADVVVAVDLFTMTVVAQGRPGRTPDGLQLSLLPGTEPS